jgi:hypothetical protein
MSTKETLKNENPFVRVGTTLYKIVSQPRLNGDISRSASSGITKRSVRITARTIWLVFPSMTGFVPFPTM